MPESDATISNPSAKGRLIMAANCLGLPIDIPARSLEALKTADLLVFEEDKPARRALKAAGLHRDYVKFTEHAEQSSLELVADHLAAGKTVCYMSDQGMPTIADPGRDLLAIAYRQNADVMVIPGPSSITAALAACPFLTAGFRFFGFPDRDPEGRRQALEQLAIEQDPIVLMDTPYRLGSLIETCASVLPADRHGLLALDISGPNERYLYGNLKTIKNEVAKLTEKINFVLVLEGTGQKSSQERRERPKERQNKQPKPTRSQKRFSPRSR